MAKRRFGSRTALLARYGRLRFTPESRQVGAGTERRSGPKAASCTVRNECPTVASFIADKATSRNQVVYLKTTPTCVWSRHMTQQGHRTCSASTTRTKFSGISVEAPSSRQAPNGDMLRISQEMSSAFWDEIKPWCSTFNLRDFRLSTVIMWVPVT